MAIYKNVWHALARYIILYRLYTACLHLGTSVLFLDGLKCTAGTSKALPRQRHCFCHRGSCSKCTLCSILGRVCYAV